MALEERGYTQVARKQGTLLDVTPGRHQVFHEEPDNTFTIETRQDAQEIVDANKRKFNDYGDKLSVGKRGEWHQVASIPATVMEQWIKETNGEILHDDNKILAAKLNDPDWKLLKTSPTNI